jgi:hypothetical protein
MAGTPITNTNNSTSGPAASQVFEMKRDIGRMNFIARTPVDQGKGAPGRANRHWYGMPEGSFNARGTGL